MKKVLIIVGPTAVGKTALSIELAKAYNGEVINGDSVQVYKRLNIGSAKITKEEMDNVVHHLIDIKNPNEDFSVAEFQSLVRKKIDDISFKNNLPIICGGTGLYIQSVLYDFRFEEEGRSIDFSKRYENLTNEELHLVLTNLDEEASKKIHPNNRRRVLRAIEIYENSQKTKSEIINEQSKNILYDALIIGLDLKRDLLYERINKRVDIMLSNGLLDEVEELYDEGLRINAIGYKEFYDYFENKILLEEATELVKKNTRNYAKRQLTYFRNKLNVNWFEVNLDDFNKTKNDVLEFVNKWINN